GGHITPGGQSRTGESALGRSVDAVDHDVRRGAGGEAEPVTAGGIEVIVIGPCARPQVSVATGRDGRGRCHPGGGEEGGVLRGHRGRVRGLAARMLLGALRLFELCLVLPPAGGITVVRTAWI